MASLAFLFVMAFTVLFTTGLNSGSPVEKHCYKFYSPSRNLQSYQEKQLDSVNSGWIQSSRESISNSIDRPSRIRIRI